MILPISINNDGKIYDSVELRRPSGGILADTLLTLEKSGDQYTALLVYLSGVVESIHGNNDVTDKIQIKSLLKKMAYKAAEYLSVMSASDLHDNDSIEGLYKCPRCQTTVICEETEDSDTTDKLNSLEVIHAEKNSYFIELKYPFLLTTTEGEVEIKSIEFQYPTIENCITANLHADKSRLQYRIYAEAMTKVNGEEVEKKERSRYGLSIFNKMDASDLAEIGKQNRAVGLQTVVKKQCSQCAKIFDAIINPINFFGSALRQE